MDYAQKEAPALVRVRARVLRALPLDPILWTCADGAAAHAAQDATAEAGVAGSERGEARWAYQMVLQLADVDMARAYIGAILLGDEAEAFFPGLPAADLRESNATLAALRARVATLCDGTPVEFCLFACRPDPADTSMRGIAYHVVRTEGLLVNEWSA